MHLSEIVSLINSSESIEKFAEDNLLKIASSGKMYDTHKHIEIQKDFAMAVKDHDFAPMMFGMRKWVPIKESVQKFLNR